MKVFLAGATGAVGKPLIPLLLEAGHEVVALTRSVEKGETLRTQGASIVLADALDSDKLFDAVCSTRPEVIIHQMTALANRGSLKNFDRDFALTNRLRTEATHTLIRAARTAGTRVLIAQSFCGWPFAPEGGPVKTEEDPLDSNPPSNFKKSHAAIATLESTILGVADFNAKALRFGFFYGPGTAITKGGPIASMIQARKMPIVGNGAGVWSFIHVQDAARATVAAIANGSGGIYNIVDDEPAPVSAWLPYIAELIGGKPPRKVPAWLGRLAIGEGGVAMMTSSRGGSNAKAKRELHWTPHYPSWREGFKNELL